MAGKISGKEFVKDIRSGLSRKALTSKYGVPPAHLEAMFNKVVNAGFLKKSDLPPDGLEPGGAPEPVGASPAPGGGAPAPQMTSNAPPVIDNRPPATDAAPPHPGSQPRTHDNGIESGKKSSAPKKSKGTASGVADIVGGAVLIGIGLTMGVSAFTGDADIIHWGFDILGVLAICRGAYRLIKGRSVRQPN